MAKKSKLSGSEQVAEFIKNCEHPLKNCLVAARDLILTSGPELTEHIKWNAPSFCFSGDDRITFNFHKSDCLMIIFHRGAKVKDSKTNGPLFQDETKLLEWLANDRAVLKIYNLEEVKEQPIVLKQLVKRWIEES